MGTASCPSGALDAVRARGITEWGIKSAILTTDDPLVVDLLPPSNFIGKHWIVEHVSFIGYLAKRATTAGTPVNGLFLCPPNTDPAETAANSTALAEGIVLTARPWILPISERGCPSEITANGSWVINYTLQPGFKLTVPAGWFLRAIVNCAPGAPAPGPGAGSYGYLRQTSVIEF